MLNLKSRYGDYEFNFCCASGALNYDGLGYFWEKPLRWLGVIDPSKFVVITKTLTAEPRKGNYRWYVPWKTIAIRKNYIVNAYGLRNPGIEWWVEEVEHRLKYNTIVSVQASTLYDAKDLVECLNLCHNRKIIGVELNVSCPNVKKQDSVIYRFVNFLKHPLILKLGVNDLDLLKDYHKNIAAVDIINAVRFHDIFNKQSPLYPLEGGLSGPIITQHSLNTLKHIRNKYPDLQIISGGGVYTEYDVRERFRLGANAVAFGTLFLRKPWKPNQIIKGFNGQTT